MDLKTRKRRHPSGGEFDSSHVISYFQKLSNDGKHDLCRELFEECIISVLSRIGDTATLMRKRDIISQLPKEISTEILRYLSTSELLIGQQVCKHWKEIIRGLPFIQLVSERLGVDKSEYGTDEQAIAICRTVYKYTKRNRNLFDDWFSYVPYQLLNDGGIIRAIAFAKYGGVSYIITVMKYENGNNQGHTTSVSVANVEDIRNGQLTPLCRFVTHEIKTLKFLSPESLFCGIEDGTIERWNMRSELVFIYRQFIGTVHAINGNEERDLLFSGSWNDLRCWSISTGELLCQIQVSTANRISSIQLRLSTDSSAPIIGVLLHKGPLHIFSYLEGDRKFERLYESTLKKRVDYITTSKNGFRFLRDDPSSGYYSYSVMEYFLQTGDARRRGDICWETYIKEVERIGARYCLLDVEMDDEQPHNLVLFEKRDDGDWHEFSSDSRIVKWAFVMADADWLNGFRPHNTNGVAFACFDDEDSLHENKMQLAFWK